MPPTTLGPYLLQERVCAGGGLETWLCTDSHQLVAVRWASAELSASSAGALLEEGAALGRTVNHPNVARVIHSGVSGGHSYQALEWNDGATVTELLAVLQSKHLVLPPELAVWMVAQLCDAVTALNGWQERVVHLDLGPDTVHLDFEGIPRLFSAGMVRASRIADDQPVTLGRGSYIAPERVKGSQPTPRTDVYALGQLLWELLSGRPLYASEDPDERMMEALIGRPAAPSKHNQEVPAEVDALVAKALDRLVLRRYATAEAFREDLTRWLGPRPPGSLTLGLSQLMDTVLGHVRGHRGLRPEGDAPAPSRRTATKKKRLQVPSWLLFLAGLALVGAGAGGARWAQSRDASTDAGSVPDGGELVLALQTRYPEASPDDRLRAAQGWELLRTGSAGLAAGRLELEQAVAGDPDDVSSVAGLALAYARSGEPQEQLDAVHLLGRAQRLGGGQAPVLRAQAGVAVAAKNHRQAEGLAEGCLMGVPEDPFCTWMLGEAQLGLGEHEQAMATLSEAMASLDQAAELRLSYGLAALRSGELHTAERALLQASRSLSQNATAQLALAELHRTTGDWERALSATERAAELDPRDPQARFQRGMLLLFVERDPEAATAVLGALAEDPGAGDRALEAAWMASYAATAAGRHLEARRYADRALEIAPEDARGRLALALALEGLDPGTADGALTGAQHAELPPREAARFHTWAGKLYLDYGKPQLAVLSLESAIDAQSDYLPAILLLVAAELRVGRRDRALRRLDAAWHIDPAQEAGRSPLVVGPAAPNWAAWDYLKRDLGEDQRAQLVVRALECGDCSEALRLGRIAGANPSDATARALYTRALLAEQAWQEAEDELRLLERAAPDDPWVAYALALAREGQDQREAGLEGLETWVADHPGTATLHLELAGLMARAGRGEDAAQEVKRAWTLDPSSVRAAGALMGP